MQIRYNRNTINHFYELKIQRRYYGMVYHGTETVRGFQRAVAA